MIGRLRDGLGVATLGASAFLLACGADEVDRLEPVLETTPDAGGSTVDEGPQLLLHSCRQDETKKSTNPDQSQPPTLRETERQVGVAVSAAGLMDTAYAALVAAQFNQLTPENEMKWDAIEPQPGVFDFSRADAIVAFAQENGMTVRGHALVWHSQLPAWMEQLTGPDAVREAMTRHIQTVVKHFRDTLPGTVV